MTAPNIAPPRLCNTVAKMGEFSPLYIIGIGRRPGGAAPDDGGNDGAPVCSAPAEGQHTGALHARPDRRQMRRQAFGDSRPTADGLSAAAPPGAH